MEGAKILPFPEGILIDYLCATEPPLGFLMFLTRIGKHCPSIAKEEIWSN